MFLLGSAFTGAQKQHLGGVGQLNRVGTSSRLTVGSEQALVMPCCSVVSRSQPGTEVQRGASGCQKSPRCVKKLWVALSLAEVQAPPSGRAWAWAKADCWHLSARGKGAYLLISR